MQAPGDAFDETVAVVGLGVFAEEFGEALQVAEALSQMRTKVQGADHWQAVDARFVIEATRRVLNANPDEQQNYQRIFAIKQQAEALTVQ